MSESTGEMSKNAQKKLLKQQEAAKKKAVKDAEKATVSSSAPKSNKIGGDDGEELDPTQYYQNRLRAIALLEVRNFQFNEYNLKLT
jgi:lysyl-tRNA synthetase class 2